MVSHAYCTKRIIHYLETIENKNSFVLYVEATSEDVPDVKCNGIINNITLDTSKNTFVIGWKKLIHSFWEKIFNEKIDMKYDVGLVDYEIIHEIEGEILKMSREKGHIAAYIDIRNTYDFTHKGKYVELKVIARRIISNNFDAKVSL